MTDAQTSVPQRATKAADAMPPLPTSDPHDGRVEAAKTKTQAMPKDIGEASIFDDTQTDDAIVVDDHVSEPDRYADVEGRKGEFVRQPFGEPRLKLQAPARAGYRRYWFNDDVGRIQRALDAGYSFVKVNGRNTRNVVGRAKTGGAQVAYLMEIPEAWFVQDVRMNQAKVDEIDAAIKGGSINKEGGTAPKDGDNRYVPKEGIRYEPRSAARSE